jgi:hypothetical protein
MTMIDNFRKFYNSVDRFFDRRAISEKIQFSREIPGDDQPKTAGRAFAQIVPMVRKFDRKAQLKLIVSQQGVDAHGTGTHWEFFFDLPGLRAQLACEWKLTRDEKADGYEMAHVTITVNPFPPADSLIRQMVRNGQLLQRQLIGMWQQEMKRTPALSHRFRDSDLAMADFSKQGLDPSVVEFSLRTGRSPEGHLSWIAQTRDRSYFSAFA